MPTLANARERCRGLMPTAYYEGHGDVVAIVGGGMPGEVVAARLKNVRTRRLPALRV
jgi:hypothetical protein